MKQITLTIIISLTGILISKAQYDDKFYYPSKEWNKIDNIEFSEYNFTIENDTLNTVLFKPEKTPKATILFYHGAGGNISTYTSIIEPIVKANYQVFAVDFRGYGKSTGKPTHLNIANDAQFIFNEMIKQEEFNNLPIIVYGASMGTQIATKIAKDNQDKVSGLILDGTISSFTDIAVLSVPEEQKAMIKQYVTSPYSAKEDIKAIENLPKLFIHSKEDASVPFIQGETVYNNASEPKELWVYEGKHLESSIKYPELLIEKIENLINLKKNTLRITLKNLRNNDGKVRLQLQDLSGNVIASTSEFIKNNMSSVEISSIASGEYAISYFHDENNNKELDTRFRIPIEGYGFSNNASGTFGPPSVEEMAITITNDRSIVLFPTYISL